MCTGPFLEAQTGVLEFPEDDAEDFAILLEYLYTLKLPDRWTRDIHRLDSKEEMELAHRLADIYILADKYQLPGLKEIIVRRLDTMRFLLDMSKDFFRIAVKIYQNTAGIDDQAFFNFFIANAAHMARGAFGSEHSKEILEDIINDGGDFAVDFMEALMRQIEEDRRTKRRMEHDIVLLTELCQQLRSGIEHRDALMIGLNEMLDEANENYSQLSNGSRRMNRDRDRPQ